jgi:hypothetical protein
MAKDEKARVGSGITAPAAQTCKECPPDSSPAGHHAKVDARINRGHGKGMGDHPNLVPFTPHE